MNKNVVIVGAGGLARMILSWLPDFFGHEEWKLKGLLSDKLDDLDGYDYDASIIGTTREYLPEKNDVFVMAIADPKAKLTVGEYLIEKGAEFITLIHPTVIVGRNVKIGRGCIICPRALLTCDIQMGDFVMVNIGVTIGHDAVISKGCTLNAHSDITGYTRLGTGVFLGSHSVITPSVKVQDFAKIGAGSVVVSRVKPETTVFGIPAKRI